MSTGKRAVSACELTVQSGKEAMSRGKGTLSPREQTMSARKETMSDGKTDVPLGKCAMSLGQRTLSACKRTARRDNDALPYGEETMGTWRAHACSCRDQAPTTIR